MLTALLIFSWALIAATALPFRHKPTWWIRLLDFPRTQIALLGFLSAGSLAFFGDWSNALHSITAVVLGCATVYQFYELSAYTGLRAKQSLANESDDPERRLRLLTANVLMTNRNVDGYIKLIRELQPDIIVLAEPDHYWEERLRVVEPDYPERMKCPLENTYGLLLYSRLPLLDKKIRFLVEDDVPSFHAGLRLRTGDIIQLHAIHPRPPHIGVDTTTRDAELVLLAKEVRGSVEPIIVTGDLNDVAWSHTTRLFLRISGLLDPRVGREFLNTFNARYPMFRWPLDHIFHSRAFRIVDLQRLPHSGSDHFPVLVDLSFEPEVRHEQERPVPEADDFKEAAEKLAEAGHPASAGDTQPASVKP